MAGSGFLGFLRRFTQPGQKPRLAKKGSEPKPNPFYVLLIKLNYDRIVAFTSLRSCLLRSHENFLFFLLCILLLVGGFQT